MGHFSRATRSACLAVSLTALIPVVGCKTQGSSTEQQDSDLNQSLNTYMLFYSSPAIVWTPDPWKHMVDLFVRDRLAEAMPFRTAGRLVDAFNGKKPYWSIFVEPYESLSGKEWRKIKPDLIE